MNINGIEWTAEKIMRRENAEVMTHYECSLLDDQQRDDIKKWVSDLHIADEDLTQKQIEDGYIGADIMLKMDTTDTGWSIQVDWCACDDSRDMRLAEDRKQRSEKNESNTTPMKSWDYEWTEDGADIVDAVSLETLASVSFNPTQSDENDADLIHLISAAPELRDALESMLAEADLGEVDERTRPIVEKARSAIRKARGGA